ncbi:MAG: quinol dehydrogenase ferredoxin subunit NapH [Burkholderiales bacterium]|nr:quinol dehydrogenase ferredoxin subunit NapH [Burkholderiales bacterium]
MNAPAPLPATGRAAGPVRHFEMPRTLAGKLRFLRFTLARRIVQFGILVAFFGTAHWGWTLAGQPLLAGNLSAAKIAGAIPMADPFAVLQMLAARHWLATEVLLGAVVVLAIYALIGGRTFCGWVCPMNVVTDAAEWTRNKLRLRSDLLRVTPAARYAALVLALVLSAVAGIAAFEWVSPIAMLHRELVFGAGLGLTAALGVFAFDFAIVRRGWCGHVCPLGAFWALAGKGGQVAVRYDAASCTRCGDCVKACPEPRVINFQTLEATGRIAPGECLNCGKCIAVCPESSLRFGLRAAKTIPEIN